MAFNIVLKYSTIIYKFKKFHKEFDGLDWMILYNFLKDIIPEGVAG